MQNWKVHASLLLVSAIYGFNYINAQWIIPAYFGVLAFVFIRLWVATGLFALTAKLQGLSLRFERTDLWRFLVCAACGAGINMVVFFQGLSMTQPVNASIIMTTAPIFTVVVAWLVGHERLRLQTVGGILLGFVGALILVYRPNLQLGSTGLWGDLLVLSNAVFYSLYLVVVRQLVRKYGTLPTVTWVFLLGAIMTTPFCLNQLVATDFAAIPGWAWLAAAYVVVGVTYVVYQLNVRAMKVVSSAVVGFYIYLQPAFATVFSLLLGADQPGWQQAIAALFIFAGVYLVVKPKKA